jgi:predicted permease
MTNFAEWIDDFVQDTRFALRTWRHSPGFALTAIVTLALGIGVNIAMFSLVNSLLLRPLYERPDEVVTVYGRSTTPSGGYRGVSYPNYLDLRNSTDDVFANLAASSTAFAGLDVGDGPRRALASAVTANYFQVLGSRVALGRPFTTEEERLGDDTHVAIISYALWERRGADPRILGHSIQINGERFIVVGVAPERFTGTSIPGPEVWIPLGARQALRQEGASDGSPFDAREVHDLTVVGRLRAGTSPDTVSAALATVARRLEQAFPATNAGYTLEMSPPPRLLFMPGQDSGALTAGLALTLMVMPAIVLLVTCLNLVDLILARGHLRRQEMAIRSSLGGDRGRLIRQLLSEGLLLALAGGSAGLLLSMWATNALMASVHPLLPAALSVPELDTDWRVVVASIGFSLAATILFGAGPAWALTGRAAATDLKRHVSAERGRSRGVKVGNGLVIAQIALSLLLLSTGGLFLMSALSAATADPGFRLHGGLVVEVDPSLAGYSEAQARQSHLAIMERLRTVPGVETVSIGSSLPFSSTADSRSVAPAGAADARSQSVDAIFSVVSRDYARSLGLPMLGGRDFTAAELIPGVLEPVAIIDDVLAERLWPGETALGRLIQFLDAQEAEVGRAIRVVGIMPAVNHSLGNAKPFPHVYVPLGQHSESAMTLQLRVTPEDAEQTMLATVARVIRDVDPRVPVVRVETWHDHLDRSLDIWLYRAGARVFSTFGTIALLLAVIGVYGVKSYVVSRRTREFGIRIAIGAHPRAVLWQVLREGGRITCVGVAIGLLLALGAGQLLQGLLYGVAAVEPIVLVTAPLILITASLLASYIPARRAMNVDPSMALRAE